LYWVFRSEFDLSSIARRADKTYWSGMGNDEKRPTAVNTAAPGGFSGVLETALYVDDLDAADRFYGNVLGLTKIFSVPGRHLTFRCQESILLIFNPQHTERERTVINGGAIPFHGARGAGHMAFRVAKSQLEAWRQHFRTAGVVIESEVSWPNGAHSIYFRDPAGNSLELATPDMWTV
jgi:catechol 2,3-dioxygenase-like lactoylglutathione lyase family enzyme